MCRKNIVSLEYQKNKKGKRKVKNMISLKLFLILMFLFIADWSNLVPKNYSKNH